MRVFRYTPCYGIFILISASMLNFIPGSSYAWYRKWSKCENYQREMTQKNPVCSLVYLVLYQTWTNNFSGIKLVGSHRETEVAAHGTKDFEHRSPVQYSSLNATYFLLICLQTQIVFSLSLQTQSNFPNLFTNVVHFSLFIWLHWSLPFIYFPRLVSSLYSVE